jgi:7-cyano-7-deazaguanine reductase
MEEAKLEALGSTKTDYRFDGPHNELLEKFESPFWQTPENVAEGRTEDGSRVRNEHNAGGSIHIEVPEFTSLCPKTGQPDFATIIIDYIPRRWCVESKALKLYLGSFRNAGEFHETCTATIINDLIRLLEPAQIQVQGQFTPRGGIPFWPNAFWQHPELRQQGQEKSRIIAPR